jgi:predicted nucleic acid-binding Zn ribbon protein
VPYENETQTAASVVQKVQESSRVFCPECGSKRLRRVERRGFMQKHVFAWFGYFPWHCRECRKYSLLRKRNRSKATEKQYVEREG